MHRVRTLLMIILVIPVAVPVVGQGITHGQPRSGQPVRTINRGGATISYYENPSAVAVAASFYVIGNQTDFKWRDFLAISAAFAVSGQTVTEPECVRLHLVSSTRTKGGKYVANHRLTIFTDGNVLLSTDLIIGPSQDNGRGGRIEVLELSSIPFKQFAELARASEVRIQLARTEFKLKKKHLEALRSMLSAINP